MTSGSLENGHRGIGHIGNDGVNRTHVGHCKVGCRVSLRKRNAVCGCEVGSFVSQGRVSEMGVVTMVGCWMGPVFQVVKVSGRTGGGEHC